jgi:small subunit ribosomal protein S15
VKSFLAKFPSLFILAGSKEYMATETKNFQPFQIHEKDTGSADVQIALLTQRINQLTEHLKTHVKDHSSRRGLLMMVAKRRSLLDYLKDTASDRYKTVLEKLNLRK